MNCGLVRRHIDAFVDGEVDAATGIDFERHLALCAECREVCAFEKAFKAQVKDSVRGIKAPSALRDRVVESIRLTRDVGDKRGASIRVMVLRPRYAIPVAAAAILALYFGVPKIGFGTLSGPETLATTIPLLEDVVRVHASSLPADVDGAAPDYVTSYFRNKVEFPVRPAVFDREEARLVGARVSNVRDRRAAALYYDVGGRRVTVVVFHGAEGALADEEDDVMHRARFHGRDVYYRQVGGYTVPVMRQDGLTYAFTGDMDSQSLLRLAATARLIQ
jgi:anti-sigma factor (TIGR02949 family)